MPPAHWPSVPGTVDPSATLRESARRDLFHSAATDGDNDDDDDDNDNDDDDDDDGDDDNGDDDGNDGDHDVFCVLCPTHESSKHPGDEIYLKI